MQSNRRHCVGGGWSLRFLQLRQNNFSSAMHHGWKQGCHILEKLWKVLDFFCCPGKSLNFVYKSWKIFENFFNDLPGQNMNFFTITGTLKLCKTRLK